MPPTRSAHPSVIKDILLKSKFIIDEETDDNWCLYRDLDEVMVTLSKHGNRVPLLIKDNILAKAKIDDATYIKILHEIDPEEKVKTPSNQV